MLAAVNAEDPGCFHWDFSRIECLQVTKHDAVCPTGVQLLDQHMKRWSLQRHTDAFALYPEAGPDQRINAGSGGSLYQSWIRLAHRGEVGDKAIAVQAHEGAIRSGLPGAIPECP